MKSLVLDISACQGNINPDNINADAVILRLGYTGYGSNRPALDNRFNEYYTALRAKGIKMGVYYFTIAYTEDMVDMETDFVLKTIKGKHFEYPIFVDVESQEHSYGWSALDRTTRSNLIDRWCRNIISHDYAVGIYANLDWLRHRLDMSLLGNYDVWVAQYYGRCTYDGAYTMWQYTSSGVGKQHGVSSDRVDCSECYIDYPTLIRDAGLNHLDEPEANVVALPTVAYGNRGSNVMALQTNLNMLGYNLVVDGKAGALTIGALKNWQEKNKLVPDGIYGNMSYQAMIKCMEVI